MDLEPLSLTQASEDLFNFAIEQEDIQWLLANLPQDPQINRHTVEYELRMLKLIGVGWCIAFFLENQARRTPLLEHYWQAVQAFSQELSRTTRYLIPEPIDYFAVLKERFHTYQEAMAARVQVGSPACAADPLQVIGPVFAGACQQADNVFIMMAGAKLFRSVMAHVRAYLDAWA